MDPTTNSSDNNTTTWCWITIVALLVAVLVALVVGGIVAINTAKQRQRRRTTLPFRAELFAAGFDSAIAMAQRPGDDERIYVVEQTGAVIELQPASGKRSVVLDLSDEIQNQLGVDNRGDERGVVGLTFHPRDPYAFVVHTAPPPAESDLNHVLRLRRYRIADNGAFVAPTDVLDIPQETAIHHAGTVEFGPDGYLYMSSGDGGPQLDAAGHAQNAFSLRGKLLRIDVDGTQDNGTPYAIPADNPFAAGRDGAPEVIALGFRNPWRFSIDHASGRIFVGDVGNERRESIKLLDGATRADGRPWNFGWNVYEGDKATADDERFAKLEPTPTLREGDEWTPPILAYDTSMAVDEGKLGRAAVGGYLTKDPRDGTPLYLFADYVSGNVVGIAPKSGNDAPAAWQIKYKASSDEWLRGESATHAAPSAGGTPLPESFLERYAHVPALGRDNAGNLYVLTFVQGPMVGGGLSAIYRLTPNDAS